MKVDFVFDVGESNEDAYLTGKDIFAVFDGANSTNKFSKNGMTGGRIAAEILRDGFAKNNGTLTDMAASANRKIMERMKEEDVDTSDKLNLWVSAAAVVRVHRDRFEWLQISDSLILVIYRDNTFKLLVKDYDHDIEVLSMWAGFAKEKRPEIKKLVQKDLDRNRKRINETYGVFDGEEKFAKFLRTGEESLSNVKHILLFTDGLFLPKEDPRTPDDFGEFVEIFLASGLAGLTDRVRTLQKSDPNCWKYPRFKRHDDITAIDLSF